jgi:ssDNA-binding Zn-finger/Zn-ribbon topoisomerase 1
MSQNNNVFVMNVSDINHKHKRGNETSSKLRLGHISKGRMERLIREEILPKLDFSDLDQCVNCIKGKFAKQIKKDGTKCSSGILELIHTDI